MESRMCQSCQITMPFDFGAGADNSEFWTKDGNRWRKDCRWCYRVLRDRFACGGAGWGGRKHRKECQICRNPFRADRRVIAQVVQAWGVGGFRKWVDEAACIRFPVSWLAFPGVDSISRIVELDGPAFPEDHEPLLHLGSAVVTEPLDNALTVTQLTKAEKWKQDYAPMPDAPEWSGDDITRRQKTKLLMSMDEIESLRSAMVEAGYGTEWKVEWLHKGQAMRFMTALHGTKKTTPKVEWSAEDVVTALMYEPVASVERMFL